ncbi:penicillin-binding protein 2 [Aliamphritea hakodatensis]|uniref:penicillin-binding protein 2 n=1 Tax=Aliamphritea hakodatensis TaxID=2895352 RepID=UPI0022FD71C1|nr:penicillin-binding protein 2 [Aliamphritea hakodatensis]
MAVLESLKDHTKEGNTFLSRALIAFVIVCILLGVLIGRLYYLQVVEYDHQAALSDDNRIQLQPVAPTRGLIYDRNGILLADNRPSYSVTIMKEEVEDLETVLTELQKLIPVTERQLKTFRKRLKQRRRPYETVPLRFRLTPEEIAKIGVNYYRLPGVQVEADLIRYYPYGASLVHALGYVGRINEKELKRVDPTNYSATHYIGKLGIEKFYEPLLHGTVGHHKVETNARGRVMRVLERTDPVPGKDIVLNLDIRLQQATEKLLGERRASVVAIDPQTGGILALVSTPGYDPNMFVTGISQKNYTALRESEDLPLFNRALRGQYPPGSTIKPVVAMSVIDSGVVSPAHTVWDPGFMTLSKGGRRYRDWKRGGHGRVGLSMALYQSCDVWFYDVANRAGVDVMSGYLDKFGFGQVTSLDLPEALPGILPSREWKKRTGRGSWFPGDSLNLSIGQGWMLATPLQLAASAMVLANRGEWKQPTMLKNIITKDKGMQIRQDTDGRLVTVSSQSVQPGQPLEESVISIPSKGKKMPDVKLNTPAYWNDIIDGMVAVVHGERGTARRIGTGIDFQIAGKTGTAQVVGIKQDETYDAEKLAERHRDHALFVAFAPVDDPKIAVAVIVENGGGGSSTAAPVAREVMDAFFEFEQNDLIAAQAAAAEKAALPATRPADRITAAEAL